MFCSRPVEDWQREFRDLVPVSFGYGQRAVLEVAMANVITMKHAGMRNNDELIIDLSDGSNIELRFSPHIPSDQQEKEARRHNGRPET